MLIFHFPFFVFHFHNAYHCPPRHLCRPVGAHPPPDRRLHAASTPLWGKMNVAEMLAHMTLSCDTALGRVPVRVQGTRLRQWVATLLFVDLLPKFRNQPAPPELRLTGAPPCRTTLSAIKPCSCKPWPILWPHCLPGAWRRIQFMAPSAANDTASCSKSTWITTYGNLVCSTQGCFVRNYYPKIGINKAR